MKVMNLKYLKQDLLILTGVKELDGANDKAWEENLRAYKARFEQLRPKIPFKTWELLRTTHLHDYTFVSLKVIEKQNHRRRPTSLILALAQSNEVYRVEYSKVREFKLFFKEGDGTGYLGIHDCVYAELLDVDEKLFSHELLFSSGATMYVEFEHIKISKVKRSDHADV